MTQTATSYQNVSIAVVLIQLVVALALSTNNWYSVYKSGAFVDNMKILQINARSLNTSRHLINEYIKIKNIDLVAVSETWDGKFLSNHFHPLVKPRTSNNYGGVALFCKKSLKFVPRRDLEIPNLEAVWLETRVNREVLLICSLYIPPGRDYLLKKLDRVLHGIGPLPNLLLLGDFNCRSMLWEHWHGSRPSSFSSKSWSMGRKLMDITYEHGLAVLNNGRYTREVDGTISSPDLSLARGIWPSWQVDHTHRLNSDHLPINIVIETPKSEPQTKWDLRNTNWESWKTETDSKFRNFSDTLDQAPGSQACSKLTEGILNCAQETIPTKTICHHSRSFMSI